MENLEKKPHLYLDEARRKFMKELSFSDINLQSSYKHLEYCRFSGFLTFCS